MIPTLRVSLAFAVALLGMTLTPGTARAQRPHPRLQGVFPSGGQAGETVTVQTSGTDLEGVDALWFDHPGLRAFQKKGPVFTIAIAPGTPVGHHDVRVFGPLGVSNPRTFVVGNRPESTETEPNNVPEQAGTIALNSTVNGRMDAAADVDCFAFEGKAGQRVLLDLEGARIDSRIDAVLHVDGPSGIEIAEGHDFYGSDPFLDLTLPSDGRYVVKVHDVIYAGSVDYGYRLTLHDGPHLDSIDPVVVAPGADRRATLIGRNLGGVLDPTLTVDGRPLERLEITLTPQGSTDGILPGPWSSVTASRLGTWQRLFGVSAWSNPVFLAEATDPVVLETEPNGPDQAQAITPPCDVFGRFGSPGDVDVYRFSAHKGEVWWIEVQSERLDAPADPAFVIQKVIENAKPQDLATGDDLTDPTRAGNPRFPTSTVDAAVRWQAPEDGTYQVVLSDLFGSQRGDARFAYRLNVRPERPDFRLYAVPDDLAQAGALNLGAGGRTSLTLVANRLDGFNGPIQVEARGLPPGLSADPVLIGPGQFASPFVLSADPGILPQLVALRLVGRSLSGDRKEVLDYVPGTSKVRPEISRDALPGVLVWPPTPNVQPPSARARITSSLIVAVGSSAPFRLSAQPAHRVVAPGGSIEIQAEVNRSPTMTEAIQVAASDLPPNVPAATVAIAKDANSVTLKLTVPANVPPGNYSFVLRGTGPFPFSKDPNAKTKPNVNVNEPSNVISLSIYK
ncbi:MAG: PPC domain-containing protein [Isosphaeraceae bacterium]